MRKLLTAGVILGVTAMQLAALPTTAVAQSSDVPLAILVPGGGTYSRPITTDSDLWIGVMSVHEFRTLLTEFPEIAEQLHRSAADRAATRG